MKAPILPVISSQSPPDVRKAIEALRVFFSKSGAFPTIKDMMTAGIIGGVGPGGELLPPSNSGGVQVPHAPIGFTVTGAFATIILKWEGWGYSGHSHTEIWRAQVDDLGQAVMIATTNSFIYADTPPASALSETYYYWIRFVNIDGIPGPYNSLAGTPGRTADDPEYMLEVLTGEIRESQLYQDLNSRIDLIDGPSSLPGSVAARVSQEATERVSADSALAQDITTVAASANNNAAAIQSEATTRANADSALAQDITTVQTQANGNTTSIQTNAQSINGLSAQYTVKIDNNGYVSGFGLASTPVNGAPFSEFIVNADRFAIDHPNNTGKVVPFIVQNGKVYMDVALIRDATIKSAKIESLAADKVVAAALSAISANLGTCTAGIVRSADGKFVIDLNNKTINVNSRFTVNSAGDVHASNIYARGDIEATTLKANTAMVGTLSIQGNAVTVPGYANGEYTASVSITLTQPGWVMAIATFIQGAGKNGHRWGLSIGGTEVQTAKPIESTTGTLSGSLYFPSAGTYTSTISCGTLTGHGECGVTVQGAMR